MTYKQRLINIVTAGDGWKWYLGVCERIKLSRGSRFLLEETSHVSMKKSAAVEMFNRCNLLKGEMLKNLKKEIVEREINEKREKEQNS